MQEEAMSGMLFWSIGSGVIRKGVMLVRGINYFSRSRDLERDGTNVNYSGISGLLAPLASINLHE
jgi:hypothetical protein